MKDLVLKSTIILGGISFITGDCFSVNALNDQYMASEIYTRDIIIPSYIDNSNSYTVETNISDLDNSNNQNYDEIILNTQSEMQKSNPGVNFAKRPVIACRTSGCTRLNDRITRSFLFNSLSNMFMLNAYSRVYICEADPFTRACLSSGINFQTKVGLVDANVKIPYADISQVFLSRGISKAQIEMNYQFLVNGVKKDCKTTMANIVIPNNEQVTLYNQDFTCQLTSGAKTNISMLFNIDYVDLDYGIIGGYYSLGMQGPAYGGGTGYALLKTEFSPIASGNLIKQQNLTANSKVSELQNIPEGQIIATPLK